VTMLMQLFLVDVTTLNICDEMIITPFDNNTGRNGKIEQTSFDFAQFNALSSQFDLVIFAANIVKEAVVIESDKITCSIEQMPINLHESFGSEIILTKIASKDTNTADE